MSATPMMTMSPADLKATATRLVEEVINKGNLDRFTDYFTADYVEHVPPPTPDFPKGLEGFKAIFGSLRAAFPDFHYTVEDTLVDGDMVVQRVMGHGTMKGAFLGMPPTGKHADWSEIHISRMGANGKFVEHWANQDQASMLTQLGLMTPPGS